MVIVKTFMYRSHLDQISSSVDTSSAPCRGLLEQVLQRPGMMGVLTSWRSRDIERLFFPPTIGRILVVGVLVTNVFPLVAEIQQYILCSLTKLYI